MHCIDLFFKVKVIFVHIYFFKIIYPSFFMHVSVTLQVISSANFINTLFTPICRQLMQILSTTIPNLNPFLIQLIFLENKIALLIIAPHLQFFYQFFFFWQHKNVQCNLLLTFKCPFQINKIKHGLSAASLTFINANSVKIVETSLTCKINL